MATNDNKTNLPIVAVNSEALDQNISSLTQQIISENDVSETQDLVELFNWNMSKKNAIRILKLSGLYDMITDQMIERFQKRSGEFSNSDLLSYLQTVENSIEKSQKSMNNTEINRVPTQIQNNTQVNFNILDSFDSDSKSRITDAIRAFLSNASNDDTPVEYEDNTIDDKGDNTPNGNQ